MWNVLYDMNAEMGIRFCYIGCPLMRIQYTKYFLNPQKVFDPEMFLTAKNVKIYTAEYPV